MSKKVDVSVIMAEYNTDVELLKESIQSILNQTFTNFELIIIDDCGKNNVNEIVESFHDPRIKVYKNEKNSGLIYSLNKAIEKAEGQYLVRMDTDDYAYPNRIESQYQFIKKHPQYTVVGMQCEFYDGQQIYGVSKKEGEVTRKDLLMGVPLIHPSVIMKKEAIEKVGKYPNYLRCEDYALWLELYAQGYKFYVLPEIGIRYTIRLNDYKKRSLKTRKGLFQVIKTKYKKLNPPLYILAYIYLKNIIAGVMPANLMMKYHKKKFKKTNCDTK